MRRWDGKVFLADCVNRHTPHRQALGHAPGKRVKKSFCGRNWRKEVGDVKEQGEGRVREGEVSEEQVCQGKWTKTQNEIRTPEDTAFKLALARKSGMEDEMDWCEVVYDEDEDEYFLILDEDEYDL